MYPPPFGFHKCCYFNVVSLLRNLKISKGFPSSADGKASDCNAGDLGLIPRLGRSCRRKWQPTPVFLPGELHGQRSLAGYSP